MPDIDRIELREASFEIAKGLPDTPFENDEFLPMLTVPHGPVDDVVQVSATNLFVVPGEDVPILHKKYFPSEFLSRAQAGSISTKCVDFMLRQMPFLSNLSAELFSQRSEEATQAFLEEADPDSPFHTLAVLGVYAYAQEVFAYTLSSRSFIDKLKETLPGLAEPGGDDDKEIDEILAEEYAMQSEHEPNLPPIEEWIEAHKQLIGEVKNRDDLRDSAMQLDIAMLLLPNRDTHPILQSRLFERK